VIELAKKSGIAGSTIYACLNGSAPGLDAAHDIADVFGLSLSGIIGDSQDDHPIEICLKRVSDKVLEKPRFDENNLEQALHVLRQNFDKMSEFERRQFLQKILVPDKP